MKTKKLFFGLMIISSMFLFSTCGKMSIFGEYDGIEATPPPYIPVEEIILDHDEIFLGDPSQTNTSTFLKLKVQIIPEYATDRNITWTSNDPNVATVSADGTVEAQPGTGGCQVTASIGKVQADFPCVVTVQSQVVPVTSIKINSPENQVDRNGVLQLTATISPNNATVPTPPQKWTSSKPYIASVNYMGQVMGHALGTTVITASSGGQSDSVTITVTEPPYVGKFDNSLYYIRNLANFSQDIKVKIIDTAPVILQELADAVKYRASKTPYGNGLVSLDLSETRFTLLDADDEIGHSMFANCRNLKSIVLPETLKRISVEAFANCYYLESVEFTFEPTDNSDLLFLNNIFKNCPRLQKIIVPTGCKPYYANALNEYTNIDNIIVERN